MRATDLGVVMPRAIAQGFAAGGGFAVVEAGLSRSEFTVSLHRSERMENDLAHRWMRQLLIGLFRDKAARPAPS